MKGPAYRCASTQQHWRPTQMHTHIKYTGQATARLSSPKIIRHQNEFPGFFCFLPLVHFIHVLELERLANAVNMLSSWIFITPLHGYITREGELQAQGCRQHAHTDSTHTWYSHAFIQIHNFSCVCAIYAVFESFYIMFMIVWCLKSKTVYSVIKNNATVYNNNKEKNDLLYIIINGLLLYVYSTQLHFKTKTSKSCNKHLIHGLCEWCNFWLEPRVSTHLFPPPAALRPVHVSTSRHGI